MESCQLLLCENGVVCEELPLTPELTLCPGYRSHHHLASAKRHTLADGAASTEGPAFAACCFCLPNSAKSDGLPLPL